MTATGDTARSLGSEETAEMTPLRNQQEIQALLRDEIATLQTLLEDRFAEIATLTRMLQDLETSERTDSTALEALKRRHALEKQLMHRAFDQAQNGPSAGVPSLDNQITAMHDSNLLDPGWYLSTYPDLQSAGVDPLEHYLRDGAFEGRDPSPDFNTMDYYLANPDIAEGGWPAALHYHMFGRAEGRALKPVD